MQTPLNKNSNFFDRVLETAEKSGISGVPALAKALGYSSPEKLYRLQRDPDTPPTIEDAASIIQKFNDPVIDVSVTAMLHTMCRVYQTHVTSEGNSLLGEKDFYNLYVLQEHLRDIEAWLMKQPPEKMLDLLYKRGITLKEIDDLFRYAANSLERRKDFEQHRPALIKLWGVLTDC